MNLICTFSKTGLKGNLLYLTWIIQARKEGGGT